MLIKFEQFEQCMKQVDEIVEVYAMTFIEGKASQRSVQKLLVLCREQLGKRITLYQHNESRLNHQIAGFYLATDEGYEICYLSDLNDCWKRFVICKELFHVILDNPEYRNVNLNEHVEDFVAGTFEEDHESCDSAVAEYLAEIAAMEFLFPFKDREAILRDSTSIDYQKIAERYMIPRYYVEIFLQDSVMESIRTTGVRS